MWRVCAIHNVSFVDVRRGTPSPVAIPATSFPLVRTKTHALAHNAFKFLVQRAESTAYGLFFITNSFFNKCIEFTPLFRIAGLGELGLDTAQLQHRFARYGSNGTVRHHAPAIQLHATSAQSFCFERYTLDTLARTLHPSCLQRRSGALAIP